MTDFGYLNYEPVVYGTVLPYVKTVEYSPIRRAYIDSLISSLIELNSEPEVVVYIDRLRECRDREWDGEVVRLVNDAMRAYHNRFIYVNGGGIGNVFQKFAKKAVGTATGTYNPAASKGVMGKVIGSVQKTAQQQIARKGTNLNSIWN